MQGNPIHKLVASQHMKLDEMLTPHEDVFKDEVGAFLVGESSN